MGVRKYTKEVIKEGKRIRWPKREDFLIALITTIIICVFCALILSLEDFGATKVIQALKDVFNGFKN